MSKSHIPVEHDVKYCTFTSPLTVKQYLAQGLNCIGNKITITGRLTKFKVQKGIIFGTISDGSEPIGLQLIYTIPTTGESLPFVDDFVKRGSVGTSVIVTGLVVKSPAPQQEIEIELTDVKIISSVRDTSAYRYGKNSMKYRKPEAFEQYMKGLRQDKYGRFRHRIIQSTMRLRGVIASELVLFFTRLGFTKLDSPILTKSDCEGAGEMFQVTTLPVEKVPLTKDGNVDYTKDFFTSKAHLTVSGQMEAEVGAQTLGKVFTFGPTFRAEHSLTTRHLAEFWMLEPELIFTDTENEQKFNRLMDLEESMIKCVIDKILCDCKEDVLFLDKVRKGLLEKLERVRDVTFGRITYTDAINILQKAVVDKVIKFDESNIVWGMDLGAEHERFICEQVYKNPVFITHYPQKLKSFYMKADIGCDIGRETCQAVDLLVPGIGELCGGSMREDDPEKLLKVIADKKIELEPLQWYVDLRYDGYIGTSGGFGLGFTRLVSFLTGTTSVRDCIPFPAYYQHL